MEIPLPEQQLQQNLGIQETQPKTALPQESSSRTILILVGIVLLTTAIVYLGYQNWLLKQQVSRLDKIIQVENTPINYSSPTPIPKTTPSTDPTANWKTYTNNKFGFKVKYPPSWKYLEVPTPIYETLNPEVWLTHTDFPRPQTDARSDLVFVLTSTDPSNNWQPQNFNSYESIDYKLGNITAKKITGMNKEGLNQELVVIAKIGNSYLQVLPNNGDESLKNFDQILSTFKFVNPLSAVTSAPQPPVTKISGILSTSDWKLVSNSGVAFKIPSYATCDNDTQCSNITYTSYYQGTPSPLPAKITVYVADYRGGSRRQQYLDGNKSIIECKPLFVESLFGDVEALQIPIDGGWCQGGYIGGIVSVVGSKLVVIGPGLTYNNDKEINRWDVRDTIVSTLRAE